jgi:hypothetical protein
MDINLFKENLALYGADIASWPEGLGSLALALLSGPQSEECSALIEEERELHELLASISFEEPNELLATRIIAHAEESGVEKSASGIFSALFKEFLTPKLGFAFAIILLLGFMTGYMGHRDTFDYNMTEESFVDLLMEGDIFEQ